MTKFIIAIAAAATLASTGVLAETVVVKRHHDNGLHRGWHHGHGHSKKVIIKHGHHGGTKKVVIKHRD